MVTHLEGQTVTSPAQLHVATTPGSCGWNAASRQGSG